MYLDAEEISVEWEKNQDRIFTVQSGNASAEKFFLNRTKCRQDCWVEFIGDLDNYHALVAAMMEDTGVQIVEQSESPKRIRYIRSNREFTIDYICYVDPWIDPHWDGDPFIELSFVPKDHPDFALYAKEALWLRSSLRIIRADCSRKKH